MPPAQPCEVTRHDSRTDLPDDSPEMELLKLRSCVPETRFINIDKHEAPASEFR